MSELSVPQTFGKKKLYPLLAIKFLYAPLPYYCFLLWESVGKNGIVQVILLHLNRLHEIFLLLILHDDLSCDAREFDKKDTNGY